MLEEFYYKYILYSFNAPRLIAKSELTVIFRRQGATFPTSAPLKNWKRDDKQPFVTLKVLIYPFITGRRRPPRSF